MVCIYDHLFNFQEATQNLQVLHGVAVAKWDALAY